MVNFNIEAMRIEFKEDEHDKDCMTLRSEIFIKDSPSIGFTKTWTKEHLRCSNDFESMFDMVMFEITHSTKDMIKEDMRKEKDGL